MHPANWIALFVSVFVAILLAVALPLFLAGARRQAADDKVRARRLADAKMNARLLRLNL